MLVLVLVTSLTSALGHLQRVCLCGYHQSLV